MSTMSDGEVSHLTFQNVGVSYVVPSGSMMAAVSNVNVKARKG